MSTLNTQNTLGICMPGERYDTTQEKSLVLLTCANDLYPFLSDELHDRIRIVQVRDFSSAYYAFNKEKPALIICGLDKNGGQFSLLIHAAARHNVPFLAVAASTQMAAKIGGVKWVLDRHKVDAVVSLANKLLDDPTFLPNSPSEYPQPGTLTGNAKETGVIVLQSVIVSDKINKTKTETPSNLETNQLIEHLKEKVRDYLTSAWSKLELQYSRQDQNHRSFEKRVEVLEAKDDEHIERLGSSSVERILEIDARQTVMEEIEAKGAVRENDIQDRIDALFEQVSKVGSVPPDADATANKAVPDESLEARFNRIESAISHLETSAPRDQADAKDFTKQFEDIWETQTSIVQLQKRIVELEERQAALDTRHPGYGPAVRDAPARESDLDEIRRDLVVLTRRFDELDQRFAAFKSMLADFERRTEVTTKVPADQPETKEQRIDLLEIRLDGIEEVIARWMMIAPDTETE